MRRGVVLMGLVASLLVGAETAQAQSRDSAVRPEGQPRDSVPACCAIVRIDSARMMVTAREMATGFTFTFEVKTRRLLRTLRVGRPVWADFVGRAVSLGSDERPCCSIVPTAAPPDPR